MFHEFHGRIWLPAAGRSARDYKKDFIHTEGDAVGWDDDGPGDGVGNVPGVQLENTMQDAWNAINTNLTAPPGLGQVPDDSVQKFLDSNWVKHTLTEITNKWSLQEHTRIAARSLTPW